MSTVDELLTRGSPLTVSAHIEQVSEAFDLDERRVKLQNALEVRRAPCEGRANSSPTRYFVQMQEHAGSLAPSVRILCTEHTLS